jgi:hypothetical protein
MFAHFSFHDPFGSVRELLCALHGHELMLHVERGHRIYLRCAMCGHETPGWETK